MMNSLIKAELKLADSGEDSCINGGEKFKTTLPENESANGDLAIVHKGIITEKMLKEERMLEEKYLEEEQLMRRKISNEERQMEEDKCYKRLNILLSRSSIYAKFMAEKLQKHEDLQKKKNDRKNNLASSVVNDINVSEKQGRKRKASNLPVKKKHKPNVTILDVFKKENMKNTMVDDSQDENGPLDVLQTPNIEDLSRRQPKLLSGGVMRSYQIDGYEWLKTLFENGVNGILADEMGLGKTIQCIALIAHLVEMGVPGPFFVCGPLSTVPNWYSEFKRFTPDIPVVLYHGDKAERVELRKKINIKTKVKGNYCWPVVITSYQIALMDTPLLMKLEWKMLVIDEAHRIKNFECKLVGALKRYNAIHRLLLTGTPLQNNLSELWSLLNFILPEIFDDLKVFQSWFDVNRLTRSGVTKEILAREQEKQIVSTIHQILTPFLLRRTKSDVELNLPNKKEVIVECPLTSLQQKYYTGVLKRTIRGFFNNEEKNKLEVVHGDDGRPKRRSKPTNYFGVEDDQELPRVTQNLMTKTNPLLDEGDDTLSVINIKLTSPEMCLRKICGHPYLISYPLDPLTLDYKVDEDIIRTSGKVVVLDTLLPELKKRGHKVLIFSQFVMMLEILEDYCTYRGYKYTRLYGNMNLAERQDELKEFSEDPSTFIFLISTRAGGLGINLVAADTVIVFDSDYNPQGDLQAQDRCHRIGQTKPVVVYRLLIRNTLDEKVFDYATAKRKLEKVIIQKGRFASKNTLNRSQRAITKEELLELLEASEVNGLVKTDDNFVISPKELEQLLDRSDLMPPQP